MGEAKITKAMTKDAAITATDVSTKEAIAKGTKVQRNYKDTVSRMLFREPENALSLYNALNGTDYTDAVSYTHLTLPTIA